jgi:inhibitor of cysteine peptidase
MKFRLWAPTLLLLIYFLSSPRYSAQAHQRTLSDKDNGQTISLPLGSTCTTSLFGNPTTGYSWTVGSISGKSVIADGKVTYSASANPSKLVGSGGIFTARFKAVQLGESTVSMQYARPWEKNQPPARTFTATIRVTAN